MSDYDLHSDYYRDSSDSSDNIVEDSVERKQEIARREDVKEGPEGDIKKTEVVEDLVENRKQDMKKTKEVEVSVGNGISSGEAKSEIIPRFEGKNGFLNNYDSLHYYYLDYLRIIW